MQKWAEEKLRLKDKGQGIKEEQTVSDSVVPLAFSPHPLAFLQRAGIVHRLDKETSGCLVIAKNSYAFAGLQKQFKDRRVNKEYVALVHGRVSPQDGTICVPLARSRMDRQRFVVSAGGRNAETAYRVERIHHRGSEPYSFLTIWPKTGRTHQIRVHLAYFGHPLVSDPTYGGRNRSSEDRMWCPRMFLHAAKISFIHPVKKTMMTVKSPVPLDLQAVLSTLS